MLCKILLSRLDRIRSIEMSYVIVVSGHLERGAAIFNRSPDDGFEYMVEHKIFMRDVNDVVTFFITNPMNCLHEEKIGEWLGRQDELNKACCKELFVKLAGGFPDAADNFRNKTLDVALRHILPIVRFPSNDVQKCEAVANAFASVYCKENPRDIPVEHVARLAISMIALEKRVKAKASRQNDDEVVEIFIRENKGFPKKELQAAFMSVVTKGLTPVEAHEVEQMLADEFAAAENDKNDIQTGATADEAEEALKAVCIKLGLEAKKNLKMPKVEDADRFRHIDNVKGARRLAVQVVSS